MEDQVIFTIGAPKRFLKATKAVIKEMKLDIDIIDVTPDFGDEVFETIEECIATIHFSTFHDQTMLETTGSIASCLGAVFRTYNQQSIFIDVSLRAERTEKESRIVRKVDFDSDDVLLDIAEDTHSKYYGYVLYNCTDEEGEENDDLDFEDFAEEIISLITGKIRKDPILLHEVDIPED